MKFPGEAIGIKELEADGHFIRFRFAAIKYYRTEK